MTSMLDRDFKSIENVDDYERALTDLSSASPRGRIYQAIIKKYRTPRATRRPDIVLYDVYEDPAPDWLWMLAKDVLQHTGYESDLGARLLDEAITWCEAGDPTARSARIRDLRTVASVDRQGDEVYIATMRRFLDAAWKEPDYLGSPR